MKKIKWYWFLLVPPAMVLFGWVFGEVVMHLWNWLLPPLFGWHTIGFWQALGLLVLSRILFGGFGGHGNQNGHGRRHKGEHWGWGTPEERERFREEMRTRCAGPGAIGRENKEPAL